jgi:hypothetical protein
VAATEEAASEAALLAERYRLDVRHATENGAETAAAARMELTSAKRVMGELLRRYEAAKAATREARRSAAAEAQARVAASEAAEAELASRTQRCAGLEGELALVGAEFHRMQGERAAAAEAEAKVRFVLHPTDSLWQSVKTFQPCQRPTA